jgi:hypothetical protein
MKGGIEKMMYRPDWHDLSLEPDHVYEISQKFADAYLKAVWAYRGTKHLTLAGIELAHALLRMADMNGRIGMSHEELAAEAILSVGTVGRALCTLRDAGFVTWEKRRHVFTLTLPSLDVKPLRRVGRQRLIKGLAPSAQVPP